MERKNIDQQSKEDFSNKVNEQVGRTSQVMLTETMFMTENQKKSWNESGYILIKNFVNDKFCNDMNHEVSKIIKPIQAI